MNAAAGETRGAGATFDIRLVWITGISRTYFIDLFISALLL